MTKKKALTTDTPAEEAVQAVEETAIEETAEEASPEETVEAAPPEPKKPTTITADRKDLLAAIKSAARATYPRTSLPILEHVHFYAKDGTLYVEATDLERVITVPVPGFINAGDPFTAHKDKLVQMLSAITNKIVEITVTGGKNWEIKAGTDIYEIEGMPAEEFPIPKEFETVASFTMPAEILRKAIKRSKDCVSDDETRMVLTGVLFQSVDSKLITAATDTHRLAYFQTVTAVTGELDAIVPFACVKELGMLLEGAEGNITVKFGDKNVTFEFGDMLFHSRLIEGTFPNYSRIIPSDCKHRVTTSREALLSAVKKASMIAKESANRVELRFKDKEIEVSAETGYNRAKARSIIPAVLEGDGLEMAFNFRYLEGTLAAFDTKSVVIELTGQLNAIKVLPDEERADRFLYLVMPMQWEDPKKAQPEPQAQPEEVPAEAAA